MKKQYHYTESGLKNIWLNGVDITIDDDGDECVNIPKINELNKEIAKSLIKKQGSMCGDELAFLRSYIDETQEQFSKRLGRTRVQIARWENGTTKIPQDIDMLIRAIVSQIKFKDNLQFDEVSQWIKCNPIEKIIIGYENDEYKQAV